MEKQISELNELDENEIASIIYERVDAFWDKFPNIHNYVTKDDMATQAAMDLYRPRKADGVPHIIHYYNTRGERSLKPLIGMIVYNVLVAEARDIHSTGVFNNDERRNVYKAISIETPIGLCDDGNTLTIGDTIASPVNTEDDVDYKMLVDSLPNKKVENVYYRSENGNITQLTYKHLLHDLICGYNLTQISDKLFKLKKSGELCRYRDTGYLVKEMKEEIKSFLKDEYQFTSESYEKGWSIL